MSLDFLFSTFAKNLSADAIVWRDEIWSYRRLAERVDHWRCRIDQEAIGCGRVVILRGDFSPESISLLLAFLQCGSIVAPLTERAAVHADDLARLAEAEAMARVDSEDRVEIERLPYKATHPLYDVLRRSRSSGLLLFSSGSTGEPKAVLHDAGKLLAKFRAPGRRLRTLLFLGFDHIGGLDTLFYALSNAGVVVAVDGRSPQAVCRAIERHRVEVLSVAPSFLNQLILSEAHRTYDLSSLQYITYGAEVMPESTLRKIAQLFPGVALLQKYGTTEVGAPRSRSRGRESLWLKMDGEGFATRVVDGMLEIKADSAMLGYLNAPSPFTVDGWFVTGDAVERDGEYLKILGRATDLINIGGEKVYPAEVESVIQELEEVAEASVFGERNVILGSIVCAKIRLGKAVADRSEFIARVKKYCGERLAAYKVPRKVVLTDETQVTERFKKARGE